MLPESQNGMSRMACEDGRLRQRQPNAKLRVPLPPKLLCSLVDLASSVYPHCTAYSHVKSRGLYQYHTFSTLILANKSSSLLRYITHLFHHHSHALQQHPHCSLQGGHWHCFPAAYVSHSSCLRRGHPGAPETPPNTFTVARVKKIISQDDDINSCSNNAAFVITVATEMFLQHLVEQSHNVVKSERKPRRNIQYRDVGQYISR